MNKGRAFLLYFTYAVILVLILTFGTSVSSRLMLVIRQADMGYDITDIEVTLDPEKPLTSSSIYQLGSTPVGSYGGSGELKFKSSDSSILHINSSGKITTTSKFEGTETTVELTITSNQDPSFSKTLCYTVRKLYPAEFECNYMVKGYGTNADAVSVGMTVYPYGKAKTGVKHSSNEFEIIYDEEYFRYDEKENGYVAIKETPAGEQVSFGIRYPNGKSGETQSFAIVPYTQIDSFDEVRLNGKNADGANMICDSYYPIQLYKDGEPVQTMFEVTCSDPDNLRVRGTGQYYLVNAGDCTLTFTLPNGFSKTVNIQARNDLFLPTMDDKEISGAKYIRIFENEGTTVNFSLSSKASYGEVTYEYDEEMLSISPYWRSFVIKGSKPGVTTIKVIVDDGYDRVEETYTVEVVKENRDAAIIFSNIRTFVAKVLGHTCLFGLLGILAGNFLRMAVPNKAAKLVGAILLGLPWGILTEYIQTFMAGRNPALTDVLIDMLGYMIGATLTGGLI